MWWILIAIVEFHPYKVEAEQILDEHHTYIGTLLSWLCHFERMDTNITDVITLSPVKNKVIQTSGIILISISYYNICHH